MSMNDLKLAHAIEVVCMFAQHASKFIYMILILALYVFCLFAVIFVAPANQTVPVNTTTSFFCRARGHNLKWSINGTLVHLTFDRQMYAESGITFVETTDSDSDDSGIHTFNETITVNASVAINNTNFTCLVVGDSEIALSNPAQLIVMGKYLYYEYLHQLTYLHVLKPCMHSL